MVSEGSRLFHRCCMSAWQPFFLFLLVHEVMLSPPFLCRCLATYTLAVLCLASAASAQPSADSQFEAVSPLKLPALKPLPGRSFRGPIRDNGQIDGFDVTGQAWVPSACSKQRKLKSVYTAISRRVLTAIERDSPLLQTSYV